MLTFRLIICACPAPAYFSIGKIEQIFVQQALDMPMSAFNSSLNV